MHLPIPPGWSALRECDLCRGDQFETLSLRDRHRGPLETVVCRACGLVSHAALPGDDILAQYYGQQYRREYHGEFSPSAYRVLREWHRGGRLVDSIRPFLSEGERVFEVGSGIGCTVKRFQLAGFPATGVEPGEGFCRYSQQQLHAPVIQGVLEEMPAEPSHDLILMVHVLEHLKSPSAALHHVRQMLRPGGRLYIEVPDFGRPHAAPGKLFHFAHIYNFTPATLISLGRAAGFELQHQFAVRNGKDLAMLFQASPSPPREFTAFPPELEAEGYAQAIAAVRRYTWLSYYRRWAYLRQRVRAVTRQWAGRIHARRRLETILAQCQDVSQLESSRLETARTDAGFSAGFQMEPRSGHSVTARSASPKANVESSGTEAEAARS